MNFEVVNHPLFRFLFRYISTMALGRRGIGTATSFEANCPCGVMVIIPGEGPVGPGANPDRS